MGIAIKILFIRNEKCGSLKYRLPGTKNFSERKVTIYITFRWIIPFVKIYPAFIKYDVKSLAFRQCGGGSF